MTALRAIGNIPNTTSLLGNSVERAGRAAAAGSSRRRRTGSTWRTATSSATCSRQILTGKLTVKQAAASASDNITSVLNAVDR